jgi:hypothetical protein
MFTPRALAMGIALLVVLSSVLAADNAAAENEPEPPAGPELPEPSYAPHRPQFLSHHYFTQLPPATINAFRSDPLFTQWPWECDPDFRHDTGPSPADYHYEGEFDLTSGVLFGISEWVGCFMSDQIELIAASLESDAEVTILTARKLVPNVRRCLQSNGFSAAQIDRINFVPVEVDSMWIRDYGPEFQRHESDSTARALVDPVYNGTIPRPANCRSLERGPLTYGRERDDASPTRLANLVDAGRAELRGVETATAYRAPVVFEGGNIFTDGDGTCFRNRDVANRMNTAAEFMGLPSGVGTLFTGWWNYDEDQVDATIAEHYNCEVVVLDSMQPTTLDVPFGGVIDHIDMSVTFLSPDTVLVGDYNYRTSEGEYLTLTGDPSEPDDPVNAAILDANAALLEYHGYDVVRIPMPVPFCSRGNNCVLDYERDLTDETVIPCPDEVFDEQGRFIGGFDAETGLPIIRTWATFANSIRIGDRLMVPSYPGSAATLPSTEHGQLLQRQEAEALQVYRDQLRVLYGDEGIEVVPVTSDGLAPCNGSLQCITKTY